MVNQIILKLYFFFVLIKIKGFSNTWGNRIKQVVKGGTVCVVT